jgi:hypothetical protein
MKFRKRPAMSAEPTEIKEIRLAYVRGVEGNSIYLNDHRIAGPKPWGGGDVLKEWKVDFKDIGNALPQIAQALAAQREGYEKRIEELEDFQSFYKAELGHYHDLVNEHEQKIKSLTVAGEELANVLKKYGSRQDISHEVGIVDSLARWEKEGG